MSSVASVSAQEAADQRRSTATATRRISVAKDQDRVWDFAGDCVLVRGAILVPVEAGYGPGERSRERGRGIRWQPQPTDRVADRPSYLLLHAVAITQDRPIGTTKQAGALQRLLHGLGGCERGVEHRSGNYPQAADRPLHRRTVHVHAGPLRVGDGPCVTRIQRRLERSRCLPSSLTRSYCIRLRP